LANVGVSAALEEGASSARAPPASAAGRFRFAVGLHHAVEVALDRGLFSKSLGQLRLDRGAFALAEMTAPQLGPLSGQSIKLVTASCSWAVP
jgi:hypothetical protein